MKDQNDLYIRNKIPKRPIYIRNKKPRLVYGVKSECKRLIQYIGNEYQKDLYTRNESEKDLCNAC